MNIIIIVSDTLRRDHLGCYGNDWIRTPNIDRLAKESVVFDAAYTGSFPTIPQRTDLFSGRFSFTYCDWQPLQKNEVVLAQVLGEAGYTSYFVADTPHLVKDGFHFDRAFSGWTWNRGQENDRYMTDPIEVKMPCDPQKLRNTIRTVTQYQRNVSQRKHEEDYFPAQTMGAAARWLERNYKWDKFFLYADTFDPHEPWDPPSYYTDMYDPGYDGEEVIYPVYGPCDYLSERELRHVRALYAGEVTMVDRWVGKLLQKVEDLGLLDNTCIVFTTDHGFYFGEHGLIGKVTLLYEEVNHIPLIIRLPGQRQGWRSRAICQPADIMPTLLELTGVDIPETVHGRSLVPVLERKQEDHRDIAVSSWSIIHEPAAAERATLNPYTWAELAWKLKPSTILDREWSLIVGAGDLKPELYHLPSDIGQQKNVFDENRDVAQRLHSAYIGFLESVGTNPKYVDWRRKL
jgi:arylsulfatase A-like enzyme